MRNGSLSQAHISFYCSGLAIAATLACLESICFHFIPICLQLIMLEMKAPMELPTRSPCASLKPLSSDIRAKTLNNYSPTPPEKILIVPDGNEEQAATQSGSQLNRSRTFVVISSVAIINCHERLFQRSSHHRDSYHCQRPTPRGKSDTVVNEQPMPLSPYQDPILEISTRCRNTIPSPQLEIPLGR